MGLGKIRISPRRLHVPDTRGRARGSANSERRIQAAGSDGYAAQAGGLSSELLHSRKDGEGYKKARIHWIQAFCRVGKLELLSVFLILLGFTLFLFAVGVFGLDFHLLVVGGRRDGGSRRGRRSRRGGYPVAVGIQLYHFVA